MRSVQGWVSAWLRGVFLIVSATAVNASETIPAKVESGVQIERIKADKVTRARVLWLPSEHGILPEEKRIAGQLARHGVESWFANFYDAMFLPPTPSAVDKVPTPWLTELIRTAQKSSPQLPLWVLAPNKAAQLAVRGLVEYQKVSKRHLGLILINPNLYVNTPRPGEQAEYWNETRSLNLPVAVLQAELSPWRWRIERLVSELHQGGSEVFVTIEPRVRDRFYFRPDALPIERQTALSLADRLRRLMQVQLPYMPSTRQSKPLLDEVQQSESTRTTSLLAYQGEQGRTLQLRNMNGEQARLADYRGKVVLLNFWASWCPPCVHEMPSMDRLRAALKGEPFEILAVNLAESKRAIKTFLMQHPVDFPILMDPSGSAVKQWEVFAYPSTYLIDKEGTVRYALFGGTEWDQPEHLEKIRELLQD